jgi:glutamine amidotransferase
VIALIDYGAGNVLSVAKALRTVGADVRLAARPAGLKGSERIVLPGVGAFGDCMASLERLQLVEAIRESVDRGVPFLGICVGMQVLFEVGEEMGLHQGLGLFSGHVTHFPEDLPPRGFKVPHTGWNQVRFEADSPLFAGIAQGAWAYFNHAYCCQASEHDTLAQSDHGMPFAAAVARGSLFGVQFHPEKSQAVGLQLLANFLREVS